MGARRGRVEFDHRIPTSVDSRQVSRRATMAGGAISFAAAFALTACSSDPKLELDPVSTPLTDTGLRDGIGDAHELVVAGAHLNVELLGQFYKRRDFAYVWTTRPEQVDAIVAAVLRAGSHGLDPALFHAKQLQNRAELSVIERELLVTDASLALADALARGAVPVGRRRADETLAPDRIDVAALLDDAIDSHDPAKVIEALAPTTPAYRALRRALQEYQVGAPRNDRASPNRLRAITVNLERQRWLPRDLPTTRAWVNVADETLVLYRADQPVFSTRVVVGEDVERNQSPEFHATIEASFYNPPWVIPADIAKAEILPKLDRDPDYLTRNKMIVLANGEVEQAPGPEAGLGLIMFDMPNHFDVYLHDTPDRSVFSRDNRRISHGCIRVQNPREFAALLMDQPIETINHGIEVGSTTRNDLPTPVPVFVVYQTAFVDDRGTLQIRPDFYNRDAAIWRLLKEPSQPPRLVVQVSDSPALRGRFRSQPQGS